MISNTKFLYLYVFFVSVAGTFGQIGGLFVFRLECFIPREIRGCEKQGYDVNNTYFYLFTRRNKIHPEYLHDCDRKIPGNSVFRADRPTVITITGFRDSPCLSAMWRELKDQLLLRDDYNVILVDWLQYNMLDFYAAVTVLDVVAGSIAEVINNIIKAGADYSTIHIIGISMGAHVAGLTGKKILVGRITGLDPAGPYFINLPKDGRLDRSDADFVDVIHTNAGRCQPQAGFIYPLGDEDFYVGDGVHQYSCYPAALISFLKGDVYNGINNILNPSNCYHVQSMEYFKPSVNPHNCYFMGRRCNNYQDAMENKCSPSCGENDSYCSIMGMDWPKTYSKKLDEQRVYSVCVKLTCPYCISDDIVQEWMKTFTNF